MKKILYINCCIRGENSRTKQLADYFLEQIDTVDHFEINELVLMEQDLQHFLVDSLADRDALLDKNELHHPRFKYAHEFANADVIVIAAPFWDLSIPALLKVYIENISAEKITFGYTANGLCGLCKASDMVFITTRGGKFKGTPMEMGVAYMHALSMFFGIEGFHSIEAEELDSKIDSIDSLLSEAKKQALSVANSLKDSL